MKYFKLVLGYEVDNIIQIDETELLKAYYCFLEKKDSVFSNGAVRGSRINSIVPDFHRMMGWNQGYRLRDDDYCELREKGIDMLLMNLLSEAKIKVVQAIQEGRVEELLRLN